MLLSGLCRVRRPRARARSGAMDSLVSVVRRSRAERMAPLVRASCSFTSYSVEFCQSSRSGDDAA